MSTSTWWQPNTATTSITFTNSYQTAIRLDSNNPQYVEGFTRSSGKLYFEVLVNNPGPNDGRVNVGAIQDYVASNLAGYLLQNSGSTTYTASAPCVTVLGGLLGSSLSDGDVLMFWVNFDGDGTAPGGLTGLGATGDYVYAIGKNGTWLNQIAFAPLYTGAPVYPYALVCKDQNGDSRFKAWSGLSRASNPPEFTLRVDSLSFSYLPSTITASEWGPGTGYVTASQTYSHNDSWDYPTRYGASSRASLSISGDEFQNLAAQQARIFGANHVRSVPMYAEIQVTAFTKGDLWLGLVGKGFSNNSTVNYHPSLSPTFTTASQVVMGAMVRPNTLDTVDYYVCNFSGTISLVSAAASFTFTTGDTIHFAYNPNERAFWFGVNGVWWNGGNPSTSAAAILMTPATSTVTNHPTWPSFAPFVASEGAEFKVKLNTRTGTTYKPTTFYAMSPAYYSLTGSVHASLSWVTSAAWTISSIGGESAFHLDPVTASNSDKSQRIYASMPGITGRRYIGWRVAYPYTQGSQTYSGYTNMRAFFVRDSAELTESFSTGQNQSGPIGAYGGMGINSQWTSPMDNSGLIVQGALAGSNSSKGLSGTTTDRYPAIPFAVYSLLNYEHGEIQLYGAGPGQQGGSGQFGQEWTQRGGARWTASTSLVIVFQMDDGTYYGGYFGWTDPDNKQTWVIDTGALRPHVSPPVGYKSVNGERMNRGLNKWQDTYALASAAAKPYTLVDGGQVFFDNLSSTSGRKAVSEDAYATGKKWVAYQITGAPSGLGRQLGVGFSRADSISADIVHSLTFGQEESFLGVVWNGGVVSGVNLGVTQFSGTYTTCLSFNLSGGMYTWVQAIDFDTGQIWGGFVHFNGTAGAASIAWAGSDPTGSPLLTFTAGSTLYHSTMIGFEGASVRILDEGMSPVDGPTGYDYWIGDPVPDAGTTSFTPSATTCSSNTSTASNTTTATETVPGGATGATTWWRRIVP